MTALRTVVGAITLGGTIAGLSLSSASCASTPIADRATDIYAPDFASFAGDGKGTAGPSLFLERRCGTLDCHGQPGRPLRIYGSRGLRLPDDAGNVPGGLATTKDEQYANWQATISVEPEILSVVVFEGGAAPERLLLVKKPRNQEGHKGGQVTVPGDDGDTCLTSWLAGATRFDLCQKAATAFDVQ